MVMFNHPFMYYHTAETDNSLFSSKCSNLGQELYELQKKDWNIINATEALSILMRVSVCWGGGEEGFSGGMFGVTKVESPITSR